MIKRRNEIGVDRFNSEYMNRPKISDNPIIREEWLQHYQQDTVEFRKIEAEGLYTIVGIDPAISQRETADYTAIITVSKTFDKEPRYYIRRAQKFRAPMREWAQQIVVNWSMYKQHLTVIEAVAGFMAAREEIEEQERIHNQRVNLRTVTPRPKEDKATRAYSVQGLFQQGRVFFDTTDRAIQNLIDELLMFTGAQTSLYPDDQVDALVYALIAGEQHSKQGEEQQRDHKPVVPTGAGFTHVSYPLGRLG
ncbi:MAG: phage terminase large subunit [Chloroflexi bacterium]|nr:phage terminase large subunit [Chloroflexota bacterium]